jgi:prephenate dehydratase
MDEKTIKERITALEGQRAQTISNVHAIEGAIQDCKYWLKKKNNFRELERAP